MIDDVRFPTSLVNGFYVFLIALGPLMIIAMHWSKIQGRRPDSRFAALEPLISEMERTKADWNTDGRNLGRDMARFMELEFRLKELKIPYPFAFDLDKWNYFLLPLLTHCRTGRLIEAREILSAINKALDRGEWEKQN